MYTYTHIYIYIYIYKYKLGCLHSLIFACHPCARASASHFPHERLVILTHNCSYNRMTTPQVAELLGLLEFQVQADANQVWLLHGTTMGGAEKISQHGFDPSLSAYLPRSACTGRESISQQNPVKQRNIPRRSIKLGAIVFR